jgi:hypothetical protein
MDKHMSYTILPSRTVSKGYQALILVEKCGHREVAHEFAADIPQDIDTVVLAIAVPVTAESIVGRKQL